MGNNIKESKFNKNIDFSVKLGKICYFPGENICGTLFLKGKPGLIETQLTEPKALFAIYEIQIFDYPNSNNKTSIEENENKYEQYALFNNFIGSNLLTGVSIPFTFQIPISTHPTCSFIVDKTPGYSKHFFSAEIPHLNVKRTLIIVIKNNANFTIGNNLFKMPCQYFKKITKSNFLVNKGALNLTVNLPKNVFYYDEPVPFEIILDCKNLNLEINKIEITLKRTKRLNYKSNFSKARNSENNILINKNIQLDPKLKEQVIKNEIYFPINSIDENFIFPPLVYQSIEKNENYFPKTSSDNPKYKLAQFEKQFVIYPSCINSMISVDYFLEIKLYFPSSWTTDETLIIPVDFLTRPDEKQIDNNNIGHNIPGNYNNVNNNNIGQNIPYYNNVNNNNNIGQNIPYYNNNFNNNNAGQNVPYYYNNVNNNIGQNTPYNYNNSNNNNYYPNSYNINEDKRNQQPNTQEVTPFHNNNNGNLTIEGNSNNNFNSQEQNQNFNNEGENTAPPPVLNYNNQI